MAPGISLWGQSEGIFTVERQGFLGLAADEYIPFPDDGTDEDAHSLVRADEGTPDSSIDFDGDDSDTNPHAVLDSGINLDGNDSDTNPHAAPDTGIDPHAAPDTGIDPHGAPDTGIDPHGALDTGINPHAAPDSGINLDRDDSGTNPHAALDTGINLDGNDSDANPHAAPDTGIDPHGALDTGTNPHAAPDSGINLDGDDSGTNPHAAPDSGIKPDNDDTDTKVNSRRLLRPTHLPPPTRTEIEKSPSQKIHSCDELRSNGTRLEGVLLITGDVVCQEERLLEITDELIILSEKPVLYLEGVRFHVKQNATLRFGVSAMHVEQLEGGSGAIFTVEPQGYVGLHANGQGPVPQDGSEVGEELRFPSSMATLDGEYIMTMGVDGSLLLSGRQRYDAFHDEMVQAAENQPWREFDTETFVSGLNPDYDGVDPRADLKVLAAADPAQAMRSIHDRMQRTARPKALENQGEETADGVAEIDGKLEDFLRERKKKSDVNKEKKENEDEDDDEEEKVPPQQPEGTAQAGRGSGSSSGETEGERATDSDSEDRGSCTSRSSNNGDESEATAVMAKNGPSIPPPTYFGDDIVLQVTKTGDVVVTVGGRIVVEKRNPFARQAEKLDPSGGRGNWLERQLWKANPLATLGRIIRRRRLRREGKSSGGSNGIDENVSFGYSLHVVQKGFEVQLDGVFVWGWDLDKENPPPFDKGYAIATCEFCWRHPR
ncbi:conserved unknown protein [Ectocarpus siliculosus]|uniref:Uncharacterized protein n=1 Tax=Ectocarpus siliculosus TaxID=2880 RepID=D8LN98_ECTSI|nr:conserved unknown protein [Ectocarpus siliculosus]|eukprot:CBN77255.1 conserved unknown protein [Ectocarpus siliculosus]